MMANDPDFQLIGEFQGIELGYSVGSSWAVRKAGFIVKLTLEDRRNTLVWLPLLKGEYADFQQVLDEGLERAGLLGTVEDFPLAELLSTALSSQSDYWAALGIQWAQASQHAKALKKLLALLMVDKAVSQGTRHAAKRLFFKASE